MPSFFSPLSQLLYCCSGVSSLSLSPPPPSRAPPTPCSEALASRVFAALPTTPCPFLSHGRSQPALSPPATAVRAARPSVLRSRAALMPRPSRRRCRPPPPRAHCLLAGPGRCRGRRQCSLHPRRQWPRRWCQHRPCRSLPRLAVVPRPHRHQQAVRRPCPQRQWCRCRGTSTAVAAFGRSTTPPHRSPMPRAAATLQRRAAALAAVVVVAAAAAPVRPLGLASHANWVAPLASCRRSLRRPSSRWWVACPPVAPTRR